MHCKLRKPAISCEQSYITNPYGTNRTPAICPRWAKAGLKEGLEAAACLSALRTSIGDRKRLATARHDVDTTWTR